MSRNPICPLFNIKRMTKDEEEYFNILFSKKSRQRLESHKIFKETHYPIEVFHENEDKLISEKKFFKRVFKKSSTGGREEIGPHCSIIIGDNGVGKSELCAYLKVELEKKGHYDNVLYIDKYESLKDIISDEIPKTYEKLVGEPFELMEHSEFKNLGRGKNVHSGEILGRMLRKIDNTYETNLAEKFSQSPEALRELREFISENIERIYGANNPIAHNNEVFENEKVKEKKWFEYFYDIEENDSDIIEILDQTFDDSVYELTKTPSISKALKKLSMDSEERLWIIFEDYDLRPLDNKKLLDFIESNAPVDIEFVIAMTPDRENKLDKVQTGTFTDRNDFYKFQGENEDIPFFNEETIAEFIEPFLYYLKNTHIGKSVCKECGKCDDEIINLYPFSHSFIKKLYNGFRKKPTPRKYVELISDLLDDFRTNYIPPYNSEILGSYKIEADIPPNLEESEAFIEWYYGEESSEKKLKKLAHSLDLDEDNLSFDILKTNTSEEGLEPIDEDNQEESKLQKLIPQIRYWIQDPSDEEYSECNSYIKQGVLFLAKNLTDNWRVDDPWTERKSPNVYFHISRSEKVHFEEDDFDSEIILIPLDLMTFESAKSLLEIGYKTNEHIYDDFNEIPKDKLKTTVGLIEYGIKNWRDKIIENNFDRDMSYSNKSQKNLDDLIAFSIGLLSDLSNPFDKYNQSDFDSIINEGINLNDNIVEYFSRKKGFDMSLIANKTKNLLELFRWRFSIDGKNLSPIKYEKHKSSFRYFYTYNYFKKTEAKKNISNKFRLGKEKTKMGNILPAIFTFVENIFENDLFSNEEYIKTNEIKNFYKNVKNIEKSDFERIDTLSYLEGTDVLAIIQSFMGGWDNQDINIFLDKLDIYLKTNSKKKDLQNIILKNDYFYNFYTKIIKTKTYKDFKDEHSYRFSDFLNFLEKQNELKKRKEKQDKIKNIKKEIGEIYDDIEIINNLENNSIEPMQRENVDNVNDLQDLKDIKAKLRQKKQNYFYSQKEKLNIFRKYKHFFEDDDMIKEFNKYIKDSRKQLSRENLKILIETRKKLENEFENIFDFIDTEKRYKLAKDNKVNLMELSGEEIEKLKKSEIRDSIYLVLES